LSRIALPATFRKTARRDRETPVRTGGNYTDRRSVMEARLFDLKQMVRFDAAPQKVAVYATDKSLGAMWCLEPRQEVFLHRHPNADDVWICLEGDAGLYFAGNGQEIPIRKGMAVLARVGETHGMRNTGKERFIFIGVAAPVPVEVEKL
jgi:mannose-6-phosphate isomerase-like protein (cupin superfamily)